eukprot:2015321-Prymnesium_polylepis.1
MSASFLATGAARALDAAERRVRQPFDVFVRQEGKRETGGWIWEAARVLEDTLLAERVDWPARSVTELGAGSGWLAMRLASLGATVTATDRAGMLGLLSRNVMLNHRRYLTSASPDLLLADGLQVEVEELDWEALAGAGGDSSWIRGADELVLGSDLVYLHEAHEPLLATLACLGALGARCVLSWEERHPDEEADLIARARQRGFACRLLHERLDQITEALCDGRHD